MWHARLESTCHGGKYLLCWQATELREEVNMDTPVEPRMASAALEEIALRRRQVVDAATTLPGWYWPIIGLAMIGLAVVVDTRNPVAIGVAAACFILVVL